MKNTTKVQTLYLLNVGGWVKPDLAGIFTFLATKVQIEMSSMKRL